MYIDQNGDPKVEKIVSHIVLIVLLVVIAFIGILSSVVLASLNNAKQHVTLSTSEFCKKYHSNDSIQDLPAKCFNYFNINSIDNLVR